MRRGYSEQECAWIDAVCGVMNRWAMATVEIEAEARLWAAHREDLGVPSQARQAQSYYASPDLSSAVASAL